MLLYLPASVSNSLPIALLFAAALSLGSLYANNELTIIFGSGVSLAQFLMPLFFVAGLLCLLSFFFDDRVVLKTLREKNEYSSLLLKQKPSLSNSDVTVISKEGRIVYRVDYYDDQAQVISGVTVVERDSEGRPTERVEAATARWEGGRWVFGGVRLFDLRSDGSWGEESFDSWEEPNLNEPPDAFKSQNRDLVEMSQRELGTYVEFLRNAGLPYAAALAERHKRFAFAFTPFIVVLLAGAVGGRYRKNVLLMSLLAKSSRGHRLLCRTNGFDAAGKDRRRGSPSRRLGSACDLRGRGLSDVSTRANLGGPRKRPPSLFSAARRLLPQLKSYLEGKALDAPIGNFLRRYS